MKRQDLVALNQNHQLNPLCAILRDNPGLRSKESVSFSSKKKMLFRPSSLSYPGVLMGTQAKPLDLFFWNEKTIQEYTISLTENQDIYV